MLFRTLAAFACAIALTATAQASTTYDFSIDNPGGTTNAGNIDAFSASYNTDGFLSFSTSLNTNGNGRLADGGWIVMSPGDNPKGDHRRIGGILYGFCRRRCLCVLL